MTLSSDELETHISVVNPFTCMGKHWTIDNLVHADSDPRDKPSGSPAKK
jgi:hypothetical protein